MDSNESTATTVISTGINYHALIRAYKLIKQFRGGNGYEKFDDKLVRDFEAWRYNEENAREKDIADELVIDELLYAFCFGEEINQRLGFELVPEGSYLKSIENVE